MRIVIVVVIVVVVVVVVLLVLLIVVVVVVVVVVVIVVVVVVVIVRRIRNRDAWSFERSGVHEIERKEERERERERAYEKKKGEQSSHNRDVRRRSTACNVRTRFFMGPCSAVTAGRRAIAPTRARIREIPERGGTQRDAPSFAVDVWNVARRSDL